MAKAKARRGSGRGGVRREKETPPPTLERMVDLEDVGVGDGGKGEVGHHEEGEESLPPSLTPNHTPATVTLGFGGDGDGTGNFSSDSESADTGTRPAEGVFGVTTRRAWAAYCAGGGWRATSSKEGDKGRVDEDKKPATKAVSVSSKADVSRRKTHSQQGYTGPKEGRIRKGKRSRNGKRTVPKKLKFNFAKKEKKLEMDLDMEVDINIVKDEVEEIDSNAEMQFETGEENQVRVKEEEKGEDESSSSSQAHNLPPTPIRRSSRKKKSARKTGEKRSRKKGAINKRKQRAKDQEVKNLEKFEVDLGFLHDQTVLSLSAQGGQRPPANGTIYQELDPLALAVTTGIGMFNHEELPIPLHHGTPYALQNLLDQYTRQFLDALDQMKSPEYRENLEKQIETENERKADLTRQIDQLKEQTDGLISESLMLLRKKSEELDKLGGNAFIEHFLAETSNKIMQHMATQLQQDVSSLEVKKEVLVGERRKEMIGIGCRKGWISKETLPEEETDLFKRYLTNEITAAFNYREKYMNTSTVYEAQVAALTEQLEQREARRRYFEEVHRASLSVSATAPDRPNALEHEQGGNSDEIGVFESNSSSTSPSTDAEVAKIFIRVPLGPASPYRDNGTETDSSQSPPDPAVKQQHESTNGRQSSLEITEECESATTISPPGSQDDYDYTIAMECMDEILKIIDEEDAKERNGEADAPGCAGRSESDPNPETDQSSSSSSSDYKTSEEMGENEQMVASSTVDFATLLDAEMCENVPLEPEDPMEVGKSVSLLDE